MKIAFFVNFFPTLSETFILNQIIGLINRGHSVDIYAIEPRDFQRVHAEVDRYRLMERTRYLQNIQIPQNYSLRLLKAIRLIMSNYRFLQPRVLLRSLNVLRYGRKAVSLRLFYSTIPLLRQNRYDIIHCQFGTLGPRALLLKKLGAVTGKLITSFRGYDASKYLQNRSGVYDELFREGDVFLPVSQSLKQRIIEKGCDEKKIIVLHSGIDCMKFDYSERRSPEGRATNVISVARLVEKKGIAYSIKAIARLITSGRQITYTVIGDGPLRDNLERMISDSVLKKHIRLLGWRNHDEVIRLLKDAHILVAPSVTADDGDQEGIPNALKEAMALGLPVVSTLHSGIPELVKDGVSGFLVSERDIDSLTNRLAYLVDHPEIWPEMGRCGREIVKDRFDINKLNDKLVDLYCKLLDGKVTNV